MEHLDYNQQMKFLRLYNAAVEAQELEARRPRLLRQTSRSSLNLDPWDPHKVDHDRFRYPPPLKRANSSGQLEERRRSVARAVSAESGYNSSFDHRYGNPPAPRRSISASDTYEGYPRVRRVSVVRRESDIPTRAPTPPIIKRKKTSVNSIRSSGSVSPSVRFSTVEDLISAYNHGSPWSGRYKPRLSISSERDSYVSAHSVVDMQEEHIVRPSSGGRRSSSSSRKSSVDNSGRRHSSGSHRRESTSGRRTSTSSRHGSERSSRRASATDSRSPSSSRRDSTTSRRSSVASRRSSVGSRRSSIDSRLSVGSRRESMILNPNGMEGAEVMRRLSSSGGNLKEWERSIIMRRRSSLIRRSSVGDSNSGSSDSESDSSSASDSEDDSSSSSGSGTTSGSSSGSSSDSGSNSDDSEDEEGPERSPQNHPNSPSSKYVAGNHAISHANGNGHMTQYPPGSGVVAMATDGQNSAYNNGRRDSKSSAMCIIL